MIAASVCLNHPDPGRKFVDDGPINGWLIDNVGTNTRYRDCVTEEFPWCVNHEYGYIEYHFAREKDAIMFALRWA
jgi:hypothetical protein